MAFIDRIPFLIVGILVATIGLAPVVPEPHVWEKIKMLFAGNLTKPIDIFDFVMHSLPWILLFLKLGRMRVSK